MVGLLARHVFLSFTMVVESDSIRLSCGPPPIGDASSLAACDPFELNERLRDGREGEDKCNTLKQTAAHKPSSHIPFLLPTSYFLLPTSIAFH